MRIEQLHYLLEVSKTQSINLASKNLHISQQSLSKSIHALENELGVSLLDRSVKGISLTPNGKLTLQSAQNILNEVNLLKASLLPEVNLTTPAVIGALKILHNNSFDQALISTSINAMQASHPSVTISLHEQSISLAIQALNRHESDLNLITLTNNHEINTLLLGKNPEQFLLTPLKEDKLLVALHKNFPLAKQKSVSFRRLLEEPLVLLDHEADQAKNWLSVLLSFYGKPNIVFKTNNRTMYYQAICQRTGIGFTLQSKQRATPLHSSNDIIILPIRDNIKIYSYCVLNKDVPPTPAVKLFIEILIQMTKSKHTAL